MPKRSKQDVKDAFVTVLNAVQPDHPYEARDVVYPIGHDDIDWGYKQHSGRAWASCGPRKYGSYHVAFNGDWKYLRGRSPERLLAVLVHEATHITEGSQTPGSGHNPTFWREYAFLATELLDRPEAISEAVESFDREAFLSELIEDVNSSMIDGRMVTVREQKRMVADDLMSYMPTEPGPKLRRTLRSIGMAEHVRPESAPKTTANTD